MTDTAYDRVEYPSFPQPQATPDRLATVAALLGLSPAHPEHCRVLELGCGDGATLLAAAATAPQSHFVGVDLAARAIERGRRLVERLGWRHVDLQRMAVEDVPDALGPFDYVVAHGLYSWVPAPARRRIVEICGDRLAPHGVAYVSFNAYPGWHVREVVRRMMLRQARGASDPSEQVRRGLELVKRVADAQPSEHPMGAALRREWERLSKARVGQVYHDELAPINQPFWLDEFLADAARYGLKFLAEAQLESVVAPSGDAALAAAIDQSLPAGAGDEVDREQYADFFRVRHFRQALLCRAGAAVRRPVDPARLRSMWVTTPAKPESAQPDVRTAAVERFRSPRGAVVSTNQLLAKAALVTLAEASPRALAFDELGRDARSRCDAGAPAPAPAPPDELERILLSLLGGAMVELHVRPPRFVLESSPRPRASALARAQVEAGDADALVTTLNAATVRMEGEWARRLLRLLDGTRDHDQILRELEPDHPPEGLRQQLELKLNELGRLGLLVE